MTAPDALQKLALACLDDYRQNWGGEIDGAWFEEQLQELGIVDRVNVTQELYEACDSVSMMPCYCTPESAPGKADGDTCNRIRPEYLAMMETK